MSPARKAFWLVFLGFIALGIVIGLIKMVAPDVASVSLNDQQVTGPMAIVVAGGVGAIPGLLFGLIVAGIVKLVTRGGKKTA